MFSAYYFVNCLLHISINYTEIVTKVQKFKSLIALGPEGIAHTCRTQLVR